MKVLISICFINIFPGCNQITTTHRQNVVLTPDSITAANDDSILSTLKLKPIANKGDKINTGNVPPQSLIAFAETLIGTPYKYASTDPTVGFDCSGFITHVFNHFDIKVPRSSRDFEFAGNEVLLSETKPGDLILFTGTDSTERTIGHMGIIIKAEGEVIDFIHSSSGKAYGVVVTPLNGYYMGRFMKVIRVFG